MPCPIWNTEAQCLENTGDSQVWDSPRAGGQYRVSGIAIGVLGSFTEHAKRLLTTWLCEQRHAGVETPRVQSDVLELVKSRRPLTVTQKLSAALLFVGDSIKELGKQMALGNGGADTLRCMAETEAVSPRELYHLLRMLRDMGRVEGSFGQDGSVIIQLTVSGWHELDSLRRPQTGSSQAFVAMWFNDVTNDSYVSGIAPAITQIGYKPMRIDKKEHNNKIDDEIISEIRRSRFLVADFTCEPKNVRGGVYYEAGFARGIDIPVIWTCKDTSMDDLHFDTRQYAHIKWATTADLLSQLKNRIGATIGDGPLPKS